MDEEALNKYFQLLVHANCIFNILIHTKYANLATPTSQECSFYARAKDDVMRDRFSLFATSAFVVM